MGEIKIASKKAISSYVTASKNCRSCNITKGLCLKGQDSFARFNFNEKQIDGTKQTIVFSIKKISGNGVLYISVDNFLKKYVIHNTERIEVPYNHTITLNRKQDSIGEVSISYIGITYSKITKEEAANKQIQKIDYNENPLKMLPVIKKSVDDKLIAAQKDALNKNKYDYNMVNEPRNEPVFSKPLKLRNEVSIVNNPKLYTKNSQEAVMPVVIEEFKENKESILPVKVNDNSASVMCALDNNYKLYYDYMKVDNKKFIIGKKYKLSVRDLSSMRWLKNLNCKDIIIGESAKKYFIHDNMDFCNEKDVDCTFCNIEGIKAVSSKVVYLDSFCTPTEINLNKNIKRVISPSWHNICYLKNKYPNLEVLYYPKYWNLPNQNSITNSNTVVYIERIPYITREIHDIFTKNVFGYNILIVGTIFKDLPRNARVRMLDDYVPYSNLISHILSARALIDIGCSHNISSIQDLCLYLGKPIVTTNVGLMKYKNIKYIKYGNNFHIGKDVLKNALGFLSKSTSRSFAGSFTYDLKLRSFLELLVYNV